MQLSLNEKSLIEGSYIFSNVSVTKLLICLVSHDSKRYKKFAKHFMHLFLSILLEASYFRNTGDTTWSSSLSWQRKDWYVTNGEELPPPPPTYDIWFSKGFLTHMPSRKCWSKKKKNEALVKLSNMPKASKPGLPTENLELLTPI